MSRKVLTTVALVGILIALVGCEVKPTPPSTPTPPPLAEELVFYDWEEDMPQSVLDAFTEEYGVEVTYLTYESQEEALENVKAGEVYDVVVLDNDTIPLLVADGLLAEIDYRNVPNFDNISANFRDLAYDPGNRHAVPFNWGTSCLRAFRRPPCLCKWHGCHRCTHTANNTGCSNQKTSFVLIDPLVAHARSIYSLQLIQNVLGLKQN